MTQDLKAACAAVSTIDVDGHIAACGGNPRLGVFMHDLCRWIATSGSQLPAAQGQQWVACPRDEWVSKHKPWGKKTKVGTATLDRVLKTGRDLEALRTVQWPSRFHGWKNVLHAAPTGLYFERLLRSRDDRLRTDDGHLRTGCEPFSNHMRNSDLHLLPIPITEKVTGAPADAGERPDGAKPLEREEAPTAQAPIGEERKSPPPQLRATPHAHSVQIDVASVTAKHMAQVWADGCLEHHKFKALPLTAKTAGQFKSIIAAFQHVGVHPLEGLAIVVKQWWEFRYAAQNDAGAKGSPAAPSLDFLTAYREVAINLVPKLVESAKRDAERYARQQVVYAERRAPKAAVQAEPEQPETLDDLMLWKDKKSLWSLYPDLKQLLLDAMNCDSGTFTGEESLNEVRGVLADKAQPIDPESPPAPLPAPVWKKPVIEEVPLPEPAGKVVPFPSKAA
jgi:hypothetical protein